MSKSRGNYIGINDPPEEMFGKTMSIPDEALPQWWELLIDEGPHPGDAMEWKLELARRITARWHGEEGARRGEEHFTRVVREHQAPEEIEEVAVSEDPVHLPAFLAQELGESSSHWRRVIDQGGVKLDGCPVEGYDLRLADAAGAVLQAGKRHFMRLTQG
jgi:tyrosyl-tRNA synthetase